MSDNIFGVTEGDQLEEIVWVGLERIQPAPNQARRHFSEESLQELADSVEAQGLRNPIHLRFIGDDEPYLIIGGERRWRAHQKLGRPKIKAIVHRDLTDEQAAELSLLDNLQREDLSPLEEAAGYARMMQHFGYTQERLAARLGKPRSTVASILTLNNLPEQVKEQAFTSPVSKSKLIELAQLRDQERQLSLWEKLKKGITVAEVRQSKQEGTKKPKGDKNSSDKLEKQRKAIDAAVKLSKDLADSMGKIDPELLSKNKKALDKLSRYLETINSVLYQVREGDHSPSLDDESTAISAQSRDASAEQEAQAHPA